jgi:hypothetical protein
VKIVHGRAHLLEIVFARRLAGCLTGRLNGRQKQADERADDGDHDQEFDEGEPLIPQGRVASGKSHRASHDDVSHGYKPLAENDHG